MKFGHNQQIFESQMTIYYTNEPGYNEQIRSSNLIEFDSIYFYHQLQQQSIITKLQQ